MSEEACWLSNRLSCCCVYDNKRMAIRNDWRCLCQACLSFEPRPLLFCSSKSATTCRPDSIRRCELLHLQKPLLCLSWRLTQINWNWLRLFIVWQSPFWQWAERQRCEVLIFFIALSEHCSSSSTIHHIIVMERSDNVAGRVLKRRCYQFVSFNNSTWNNCFNCDIVWPRPLRSHRCEGLVEGGNIFVRVLPPFSRS